MKVIRLKVKRKAVMISQVRVSLRTKKLFRQVINQTRKLVKRKRKMNSKQKVMTAKRVTVKVKMRVKIQAVKKRQLKRPNRQLTRMKEARKRTKR